MLTTTNLRLRRTPALLATAAMLASPAAFAGATIKVGDDASVTIGGGIRVSFTSVEDGSPSGTSRGNDFNLENARLYVSGRIDKVFGATFNTEIHRDAAGNEDGICVMDAYLQYEPSPLFNVWAGRMLPPSDRANLDGPFYLTQWDYPLVSQYPNLAVGRDNGVTVWGKPLDGKLTYAVGAFQGHNRCVGCSNDDGKPLLAARLAYAFLDAEPAPAYYTASTYFGAKDILTVGIAAMYQKDGVGTSNTVKDDYQGYNADLLFEKNLGPGVLTLEGAAYKYDFDVADAAPATGNIGGLAAGRGVLAGAAWLFPQAVGHGKFQPFLRHQRFEPDGGTDVRSTDVGVNYLIAGYNAKLVAVYTRTEVAGTNRDKFLLGAQFQY